MSTDYDMIAGFSFLAYGMIWLGFFVFWIFNNYHKNRRHLKPLHKFMNFIVACKSIECFCMVGYILNQSSDQYWEIAVTSMITIYKTFTYTSLILASKGFCIISDILQRRELSTVALVMGSVYLVYSAYFIEMSLVIIVLLCMILVLFYLTTKYTISNIVLLKSRQRALIEGNIQNLPAAIQAKITLFVRFLRLSCYYFTTQFIVLLIAVITSISNKETPVFDLVINIFNELFELLTLAGILYLLRPKNNVQFFDINFIEPGRPNRPLAPLYEAKLPEEPSILAYIAERIRHRVPLQEPINSEPNAS